MNSRSRYFFLGVPGILGGVVSLVLLLWSAPGFGQDLKVFETRFGASHTSQLAHRYTYFLGAAGQQIKHGVENFWWKSGALMQETRWTNGIKTGVEQLWYEDGKPREENSYDAQGLLAVKKTFWPNGNRRLEGQFRDGLKEGVWVERDNNGKPELMQTWSEGLLSGTETAWFPNSDLRSRQGEWVNGKKHGQWTHWSLFRPDPSTIIDTVFAEEIWSQDVLQSRKEYIWTILTPGAPPLISQTVEKIFVGGKEDHQIKTSFETNLAFVVGDACQGAIALKPQVIAEFRGGELDGAYRQFFCDGTLALETAYLKGKRTGTEVLYHKNGTRASVSIYVDGVLNGPSREFFPTGILKGEEFYRNGLREGVATRFYESGSIQSRRTYWNHQLHGPFTEYHENGKVNHKGSYSEGKTHGLFETYNESGTLILQFTYDRGRRHGLRTEWSSFGSLQSRQNWRDDQKHGLEVLFSGGKVQAKYTYQNGVLQGPSETWAFDFGANGEHYLATRGQYFEGQPCGTWTYFASPSSLLTVQARPFSQITLANCQPQPLLDPTLPLPPFHKFTGRVVDGKTLKGIDGATVRISNGTTKSKNGSYALRVESSRMHTIRCEMPGYFAYEMEVPAGNQIEYVVNIPLQLKDTSLPMVLGASSGYGTVFLAGISLINTYDVYVDWNEHVPGHIEVDINDGRGTAQVPAFGRVTAIGLDMAAGFVGDVRSQGNSIVFTAVSKFGARSPPRRIHPVVLPFPSWANGVAAFRWAGSGQKQVYAATVAFPQPAISLLINQEVMGPTLWQGWSLVPFIGGQEFGLHESQFNIGMELATDGVGTAQGGAQSGFSVGGIKILGKGQGKGKFKYVPNYGIQFDTWDGQFLIEGSFERTNSLRSWVPALAALENKPVIGRAISYLNQSAVVKGTIGVGGGVTIGFTEKDGQLMAKPASPEIRATTTLGVSVKPVDKVSLELVGGGMAKVLGFFPATNSQYLDRFEAELSGKASVTVLRFKFTPEEKKFAFRYPLSGSLARSMAPRAEVGLDFRPIGRQFLSRDRYSHFVGNAKARNAVPRGLAPAHLTEKRLIENVFHDSEPVIAELNGKVAIAFVYFDPADPTLQASEISFILHEGGTYTAPALIQDDKRSDFAPTIAFDKNAKLVAVWERVKSEDFKGEDIAAMAKELEIVFSVYNPETLNWTVPEALTDNNHLDHSPILSRGMNGELLLVWQSNAGNELIGSAGAPSEVYFAKWDAETRTFGQPGVIPGGFENSLTFAMAFDGTGALLAYAKDIDGDLSTSDQEIFYRKFDGASWQEPIRVTNDLQNDGNPEVVFKQPGAGELIWRKGSVLTRLVDWTTGAAETIREASGSLAFSDFKLACDPSGRLAMIWQETGNEGTDLFYSVYDASLRVWSKDQRLTLDGLVEKDFRGGFAGDGTLHLVYNKKDTAADRSDLYHLTRRLGSDVVVAGDGVGFDPAHPRAGAETTIRCVIQNRGDLAVENVEVAFFHGDPNLGGQPLGSARVVPAILRGGEQGVASLSWKVPVLINENMVFVVVDPTNAIGERDETNNRTSLPILLPDLRIVEGRIEEVGDGSVQVIALVENLGAMPVKNVQVLFRSGGREIGSAILADLHGGTSSEVSMRGWADLDFASRPAEVEVVVDPANRLPESDEENNGRFLLGLLSGDADRDGMDDAWENRFFGLLEESGHGDSDGDGLTDATEFETGTDPKNVESTFRATIGRQTGVADHVLFTWPANLGKRYQIQFTEELGVPNWQNLGEPLIGGAASTMTAPLPFGSGARFYRVILLMSADPGP